MKAVPGKRFDVRYAGQFRPVKRPRRQHHELGANIVVAIGADPPALDLFVPPQIVYLGGKDRRIVEPKMLADVPAVLVDLGAVGELLRWHEVEFFEKWYIAI